MQALCLCLSVSFSLSLSLWKQSPTTKLCLQEMNRIGNKTVETLVVTRSNNSSNKQSFPEEISVYKQTNLKMQALVLCLSVSLFLSVWESIHQLRSWCKMEQTMKAIAALVELLRENRQKKSTWLWEAVHSTTTTNGRSSNSSSNRTCNSIHTLTYKLLLLQQHLGTGLQLSAQDCEKKPW
jgi:hypothetical protein